MRRSRAPSAKRGKAPEPEPEPSLCHSASREICTITILAPDPVPCRCSAAPRCAACRSSADAAVAHLEATIARLLGCAEGRTPVELQSQQYLRVRNTVARMVNGLLVPGEEVQECVALGMHGLVLILECQRGECVATLKWAAVVVPVAAQEAGEGAEGAKEEDNV